MKVFTSILPLVFAITSAAGKSSPVTPSIIGGRERVDEADLPWELANNTDNNGGGVIPLRSGNRQGSPTLVGCGANVKMQTGVDYMIRSPNYPSDYGMGERCLSIFKLAEPNYVNVQCTSFDVHKHNSRCQGDFLQLKGDTNYGVVVDRYCNDNYEAEQYIGLWATKRFDVLFKSNNAVTAGGYECYVWIEDKTSTTTTPASTTTTSTKTTATSTKTTSTASTTTTSGGSTTNEICQVCGVDQTARIINGVTATEGSIPWAVLIYIQVSGGWYTCGATLVGKRTVVTAAHCVDGAIQVAVYLGAHSRASLPPVTYVPASNIYAHEAYSSSTIQNDIALLILPSDVTFNEDIRPACLPADLKSQFGGQPGTISGWGKDTETGGVATLLQTSDITIKAGSACTPWASYPAYFSSDRNICTYKEVSGVVSNTCNGDSGGPLTKTIDGRETLLGATSYGSASGCALVGYANVFTRVQYYLANGWIQGIAGDDFCQQ